jgi:hypothetical protein
MSIFTYIRCLGIPAYPVSKDMSAYINAALDTGKVEPRFGTELKIADTLYLETMALEIFPGFTAYGCLVRVADGSADSSRVPSFVESRHRCMPDLRTRLRIARKHRSIIRQHVREQRRESNIPFKDY